jgi:hypothetical protein
MRITRRVAAGALAVLLSAGCIMSAQILISFDIPNLSFTNTNPVNSIAIDLNTISDYTDNKDKIDDVSDMALLGIFANNDGSSPLNVVVWMTPTDQGAQSAGNIPTLPGAVKVWGDFALAPGETKQIGWDESAKLFNDAGLDALLEEIKGDGRFALYAIGATGTFDMSITSGSLVMTLEAKD